MGRTRTLKWATAAVILALGAGLPCIDTSAFFPNRALAADKAVSDEDAKFFREEIEPIFEKSCWRCHGKEKQESELRLDSRDALLKGGKNGPAIVSGDPDESLLLKVLAYDGDIQMPPDAKLEDDKISALKRWVEKEAPWPKSK